MLWGSYYMKWFSQRKGLKKIRTEIQINSMDNALRNRLWNVFDNHYLKLTSTFPSGVRYLIEVMKKFWDEYLKLPIYEAPHNFSDLWEKMHHYFFNREWYEIFDLLEFMVTHYPVEKINEGFMKACNVVLESEMSAYRFVGKQITQITSEEEISEIEEALETPFKNVNAHIERALSLMSDRKSPDYRNSIKESISAVEAICRIIAQDEKATLGKALDAIERQGEIDLHPALKKAFDSLYGYTSSAEGIRHALLDEEVCLSFEDAKFMLVSCSAFINYLISKASMAGILKT